MPTDAVVKMDDKGRIQVPKKIRRKLGVRPGQNLLVESKDDMMIVRKSGKLDPMKDPLLYDIMINPGHSRIGKITREKMEKMEDGQWLED